MFIRPLKHNSHPHHDTQRHATIATALRQSALVTRKPCLRCSTSGEQCTYARPTRKRGPKLGFRHVCPQEAQGAHNIPLVKWRDLAGPPANQAGVWRSKAEKTLEGRPKNLPTEHDEGRACGKRSVNWLRSAGLGDLVANVTALREGLEVALAGRATQSGPAPKRGRLCADDRGLFVGRGGTILRKGKRHPTPRLVRHCQTISLVRSTEGVDPATLNVVQPCRKPRPASRRTTPAGR